MATIGAFIRGDARFATLVKAVDTANLGEMLDAVGDYTAFLPTNDAFASLPEGNLERLLKDAAGLRDLLTYHVVQGRLTLTDISTHPILRAISGKEIPVVKMDKYIYVDDAMIIQPDVPVDNGIAHVVDQVLLPF